MYTHTHRLVSQLAAHVGKRAETNMASPFIRTPPGSYHRVQQEVKIRVNRDAAPLIVLPALCLNILRSLPVHFHQVQYQFPVYFLSWGFLPHKPKHCPCPRTGILFLRGIPRKSSPPVSCHWGGGVPPMCPFSEYAVLMLQKNDEDRETQVARRNQGEHSFITLAGSAGLFPKN